MSSQVFKSSNTADSQCFQIPIPGDDLSPHVAFYTVIWLECILLPLVLLLYISEKSLTLQSLLVGRWRWQWGAFYLLLLRLSNLGLLIFCTPASSHFVLSISDRLTPIFQYLCMYVVAPNKMQCSRCGFPSTEGCDHFFWPHNYVLVLVLNLEGSQEPHNYSFIPSFQWEGGEKWGGGKESRTCRLR